MRLKFIMEFRPLILFVCSIVALGGLKILLSFFPKDFKYPWTKVFVSVVYGVMFLFVLDTPMYEDEVYWLGRNTSGEFFEAAEAPWACPNQAEMDFLFFFDRKTGTDITFPACQSHIWAHVVSSEDYASAIFTRAYSLLKGSLFYDEYEPTLEFRLPESEANLLHERWGAHVYNPQTDKNEISK